MYMLFKKDVHVCRGKTDMFFGKDIEVLPEEATEKPRQRKKQDKRKKNCKNQQI